MRSRQPRESPSPEYRAFTKMIDSLLSVSRDTINARHAKYREQVDANPKRRGPKRKVVTPSAGDHGGA